MTKEQFLERCQWIADSLCEYNIGSLIHPNWQPCEAISIRGSADFYRHVATPTTRERHLFGIKCGDVVRHDTKLTSLVTRVDEMNAVVYLNGMSCFIEDITATHISRDGGKTWVRWCVVD